jgi:hypothetical protein
MPLRHHALILTVSLSAFVLAAPASAADVDGPDDCTRATEDFGDAPESVQAYPLVPGAFPTCVAVGPVGTRQLATAPISTPPGPAGFVRHVLLPTMPPLWLGCTPATGPMGVDGEPDGKVNDNGGALSACAPGLGVDCLESAFGLVFGQDDCIGGTDAALAGPQTFFVCHPARFTYTASNCAPVAREAYLNVCLDMNRDGDWNDNFACPGGLFAYEWALKNVPIVLPPGCATLQTPSFLVGPHAGEAWLRVTLTVTPVPDDFPWNGSAGMPGMMFENGETEDHPVTIAESTPCPDYSDFGDAPDDFPTYALGIVGNFPTCVFPGLVGSQSLACPPISTPPQATGYVEHRASAQDAQVFWLGCGAPGVDGESDGKTNLTGAGTTSICNPALVTDCAEPTPWGTVVGQDECFGDGDAGVTGPIQFETCQPETIRFELVNCRSQEALVHLNVLVDWNEDADWNDNFLCPNGVCVYEWVIKNQTLALLPGCNRGAFIVPYAGPRVGHGWMRVSVSTTPVNDDFPWAGSATMQPAWLSGGETEDYPVAIVEPEPCARAYDDLGDAPEGFPAYPGGAIGMFPTCVAFVAGMPSWNDYCATPTPAPPIVPSGFVQHRSAAGDALAFWLGCGLAGTPHAGVDGETEGKTTDVAVLGTQSFCNPTVPVDCVENAFGLQFGQDECYGDPDAGISAFFQLQTCVPNTVTYQTYSCAPAAQEAYLNILVDMNQDGDWSDRASCPGTPPASCPWEWAVQNVLVSLPPGCATLVSPPFLVGARTGLAWLRITLSEQPAPPDFASNGTQGMMPQWFARGETEDYPVEIALGPTGAHNRTPERIDLLPLVPNPARRATAVRFTLPATTSVHLAAYDLGGRLARVLFRGHMSAGAHDLRWDFTDDDGRPLPAGVYVVRLDAGAGVQTQRVIRIR